MLLLLHFAFYAPPNFVSTLVPRFTLFCGFSKTLIESLIQEGFTDPARIYIQSFEFEGLIELGTDLLRKNML